jgi:hypothetical protein
MLTIRRTSLILIASLLWTSEISPQEIPPPRPQSHAKAGSPVSTTKAPPRVTLVIYSTSDSLVQAIIKANNNLPNEYNIHLLNTSSRKEADVIIEKVMVGGIFRLTLTSGDTHEILHSEVESEEFAKRAITSMSKWITSRTWE